MPASRKHTQPRFSGIGEVRRQGASRTILQRWKAKPFGSWSLVEAKCRGSPGYHENWINKSGSFPVPFATQPAFLMFQHVSTSTKSPAGTLLTCWPIRPWASAGTIDLLGTATSGHHTSQATQKKILAMAVEQTRGSIRSLLPRKLVDTWEESVSSWDITPISQLLVVWYVELYTNPNFARTGL